MKSLRTKLLVLQILIVGVLLLVVHLVWQSERSAVTLLQTDSELRCSNLMKRAIDFRGENLSAHVRDYSFWDEMVDAVRRHDIEWCDRYLPEALQTFNLHAAWLCDTTLQVIYSTTDRGLIAEDLPAPRSKRDSLFSYSRFRHYFRRVQGQIFEVSIAPIHYATDVERKGHPQGYYVAARLWNEKVLDDLSLHSEAEISVALLSKSDSATVAWRSEPAYGILRFEDTLRDWREATIAVVRGQSFSRSLRELNATSETRHGLFLGIGLLLVVVWWACLRFWLLTNSTALRLSPPEDVNMSRETNQPVHTSQR